MFEGRGAAEITIFNPALTNSELFTLATNLDTYRQRSGTIVITCGDQLNGVDISLKEMLEATMKQCSISPAFKTKVGAEGTATISISSRKRNIFKQALNAKEFIGTGANVGKTSYTVGDNSGTRTGSFARPFKTIVFRPYDQGVPSNDINDWIIFPFADVEGDATIAFKIGEDRGYMMTATAYDPNERNYKVIIGDPTIVLTGVSSISPVDNTQLSTGYDVIVLAGQSNAEGSGYPKDPILDFSDPRMFVYPPGNGQYSNQLVIASEHLPNVEGEIPYPDNITFATHFGHNYLNDYSRKIVILTCALGNTGFSTNRWNVGDDLYNTVVTHTNNFLNDNPGSQLIAFLWHQGERDHDNGVPVATQKTSLLSLIDGWRSSITGATNVPFICGGLSPDWLPGDLLKSEYNDMFSKLNLERSYVGYADSVGLSGGGTGNDIHFNAPALRTFGLRYYNAWKIAKNYILGSNTPPATNLQASTISNSIVKLTWSQIGVYIDFVIQYRQAGNSTWLNTRNLSVVKGLVTNLTPNTPYEFRIKTNGANNSIVYSSVITQSTNNTTITTPDPDVWLMFETNVPNENNFFGYGYLATTGGVDSTNLVIDSIRGNVCRLNNNQGFIAYQNIPSSYTKSSWIKLDSYRGFSAIFGAENGDSEGRVDLMVNNANSGFQLWKHYNYIDQTSEIIPINTWVHVALTIDNVANIAKIYWNGIKVLEVANFTHNTNSTNNTHFIGVIEFGNGSWDNYLDDVQFWSLALTDQQIAKIYQNTYK